MSWEMSYDLKTKYGDCLVLDRYGDTYSLCSGRMTKAGVVRKDWCFPRDAGGRPRERAIPLGVRLGDRAAAIAAVRWLLAQLEAQPQPGQEAQPARRQKPQPPRAVNRDVDDDPPF